MARWALVIMTGKLLAEQSIQLKSHRISVGETLDLKKKRFMIMQGYFKQAHTYAPKPMPLYRFFLDLSSATHRSNLCLKRAMSKLLS